MGVNSEYWMRGEITELATALAESEGSSVSPQHVHDIICGRRNVSFDRAKNLVDAAHRIGKLIPLGDWMDVKASKHRAFEGVR